MSRVAPRVTNVPVDDREDVKERPRRSELRAMRRLSRLRKGRHLRCRAPAASEVNGHGRSS